MKRSRMKRGTKRLRRRTPLARTRGKKKDPERKDRALVAKRASSEDGHIYCEVRVAMKLSDGSFVWPRCTAFAMRGIHHLEKRSQGGKRRPLTHKMKLCGYHHDAADNADVSRKSRNPLIDGIHDNGRLFIQPVTFLGRFFYCPKGANPAERAIVIQTARDWVTAPASERSGR